MKPTWRKNQSMKKSSKTAAESDGPPGFKPTPAQLLRALKGKGGEVMAERKLFCPDCGRQTLELIERTEPIGGEYKEVYTCEPCTNMVHVFREVEDDGYLRPCMYCRTGVGSACGCT